LLAVLSAAIGVGLAIKFGTRTWRAEVVLVCAKGTPAAIADIITFPNIKTLENMVKLRDNIDEVRSRLKLPIAVKQLGSQIDVIGERSSALMSIRATAGDPDLAAAIANTMAQVFIENQKEFNRQEAARLANHYRQEYEQAVADAKEAEAALNKFSAEHTVSDLSKEIQSTLEQLVSVDMVYQQLKAEKKSVDVQLEDMQQIITRLKKQVADEKHNMSSTETLTNLRIQIDRLQDRITRTKRDDVLAVQLQEAKEQYAREKKLFDKGLSTKALLAEAEGRVKVLEAQLHDTPQIAKWKKEKERLDSIVVPENNQETPTTAMLKEIMMKKFDLELQKSSVQCKVQLYKEMQDELKQKLAALPKTQAMYVELKRGADVAEALAADLKEKLDAAQSVVDLAPSGIKILTSAKPPQYPKSSTRKLIAAGVTFMLFAMTSFCFLVWEFRDLRPKSAGDVRAKYKVDSLIELPVYASGMNLMPAADRESPLAEHMRFLSGKLHQNMPDSGACVMITSADREEGKTVLAWNLIASLARIVGGDVVVVDCDIRDRTPDRYARLPVNEGALNGPGLTGVLVRKADPGDVVVASELPGVSFIHRGNAQIAPELLGNSVIGEFFEHLRARFEFILIDGPAIMPFVDAEMLARLADGVIWVVRAQHHGFFLIRRASMRLKEFRAPCIGAVATFVPQWCYGLRYLDEASKAGAENQDRERSAGGAEEAEA